MMTAQRRRELALVLVNSVLGNNPDDDDDFRQEVSIIGQLAYDMALQKTGMFFGVACACGTLKTPGTNLCEQCAANPMM
jgi:hypothetical protein